MSNKIFKAVSGAINRAERSVESSALRFPLITPPVSLRERFN